MTNSSHYRMARGKVELGPMAFNHSIQDPFERLREFWERYTSADGGNDFYDANTFSCLTPHSVEVHDPASHPSGLVSTTRFVLTVSPQLCNRMANLHGGAAGTVFDLCSSFALAAVSRPGFWEFAGVSRTLASEYLRPVPAGAKVMVVCEIVGISKRLVSMRGVMKQMDDSGKETGPALVSCGHGKVNIDPPKEIREKL